MLTRPQTFSYASTPSLFQEALPLPLSKETLSGAVLMAAVLFNAGLAFLNAHIVPLGRDHVILAEVAVIGASLFITAMFFLRSMVPWLLLLRAPCGGAMYANGTYPSDVSGKLPAERCLTSLEGSCSTARPTQ